METQKFRNLQLLSYNSGRAAMNVVNLILIFYNSTDNIIVQKFLSSYCDDENNIVYIYRVIFYKKFRRLNLCGW